MARPEHRWPAPLESPADFPGSHRSTSYGQLILLPLFFAVFYFLLIRPQQKRVKEHTELISSLEAGDDVLTTGGLYGTITTIDGQIAEMEIADGVVVRIQRGGGGRAHRVGHRRRRHPATRTSKRSVRRKGVIPLILFVVFTSASLPTRSSSGNSPVLGLDLQGGVSVVLQPSGDVENEDTLDQAVDIIRNRIDALGVAEPDITRQGRHDPGAAPRCR